MFRTPVVTLMVAAALLASVGCDQGDGRNNSSSEVFIAPVPLPVNDAGFNPVTGKRRVEALVTRTEILKTVNPNQVGIPADADPETLVLGTLSASELILFERESSTLLKADLSRLNLDPPRRPVEPGDPTAAISRQALATIFLTPKANFDPQTFVEPFPGVLFGYETSGRSLFVLTKDANGFMSVKILSNSTQIQNQIRSQTFNFRTATLLPGGPGTAQFRQAEILLVSALANQDPQLFVLRQDRTTGEVTGEFRVFDQNGQPWPDDVFGGPNFSNPRIPPTAIVNGLVTAENISIATDSAQVDISDFRPRPIPSSQRILIFDRVSSSFLEIQLLRDVFTGNISGRVLSLFTRPGEVQSAIRQGSATQGDVELEINESFVLPDGNRIVAFDEATNNMLSLNPSVPFGLPRVAIFANANELLQRRDTQTTVDDIEFGLSEPEISFSNAALGTENLLLFDAGNDQIINLNLSTQIYVVVVKQRDIGEATGVLGVSDLTYVAPMSDTEILTFDTQGNALLIVRLDYALFPVRVSNT